VELEVTVQLGQTTKNVREILALGPGQVIELDRLAGDSVDILVNGRLVAKAEVVVIGDNFGVRITELIRPEGGRKA
jgi:flagellar motor switch protein FliN/FliY